MRKSPLQEKQVSPTAFVDDAASKARWIVQREVRGPGDLDNAMRRVEARHGLPYSLLWSLRYRRSKDILTSYYVAILNAYEAECERQKKLIEHERAITRAKSGFAASLVSAADALASKTDELKD